MKAIVLILGLLLMLPVPVKGATLQQEVIKQAVADLGVRELTNHNDSPRIDEVLTYMRLPLRLPYCASFVVYWYNHAGFGAVLPRTGGVMELERRMRKDELKYKIIRPESVLLGIVSVQEADILCWNYGGGKGHTGVAVRPVGKKVETIEANTQSGDKGNQREGGGVYRRLRSIKVSGSGKLDCFARVRSQEDKK
jgi:hypothetical protein